MRDGVIMAVDTRSRFRRADDTVQPADPLPHFIAHLLRAAEAAPSVHETNPWRFRYRPASRAVELHADFERALRYNLTGRDVHIGCGAALFNLRLAVAWMGREPVVRLLPRPDEPLLMASVQLAGAHRPVASERELYAAISRRRTGQQPFANRAVPGTVLAELAEAARVEGAMLHLLHPAQAQRVLPGISDPTCEPRFAVLSTQFRAREDWLRAGQALQRMLLLATARGVSVQPLTKPLEVPDAWLVRDPHTGIEQPQMIVRLGYAPRWDAGSAGGGRPGQQGLSPLRAG